jgi:hypothetical protein
LVVAITTFIEKWGPIVQAQPAMIPLAFELLSFALGGFKAGKGVEDAIEQAKTQLEQMAAQKAAQPPPDPEAVARRSEKQRMKQHKQVHGMKMQEMEMQHRQHAAMQPQGTIDHSG